MSAEPYQKIYQYKRVAQAKLFIDSHFAENIDLSNIADQAYFSKFHFIRLFKSSYGKTPHGYLTQVRINNAKQLLIKNKHVTEVCFQVGFDSPTSFTALFKRIVGLSPYAFQLQQLERNRKISASPLHFIPNCFAQSSGWIKNSNFQEVII